MSTPPQPPFGGTPHPYSYPYPAYGQPGPAPQCEVCGAAPAAAVTIRGHQGMIVVMRSLRRRGVFCRTCGLSFFRDMQANTMLAGWWGLMSMFITPVTLLLNLSARAKLLRLAAAPPTPGWRPPLDPGKPLMRRPEGVIALIPLALVGLLVLSLPVLAAIGWLAGDSKPTPLTPGSCALNAKNWPDQDLKPVDCDSAAAEYRVTTPTSADCGPGDYLAYPEYSEDGTTALCLHPLGN